MSDAPENPDEYEAAARAAYGDGNIVEALRLTEEAISRFPQSPDAWASRMGLFAALEQEDDAIACADEIVALDPQNASFWFQKGRLLQDLHRLDEAAAAYVRATELAPEDPDAWVNLGCVQDDAGDPEAAVSTYDRVLKLDPNEPFAWNNRGNSLTSLGDFDEAARSFERALGLGHEEALAGLRSALVYAGRVDEANRHRKPGSSFDHGEAREVRLAFEGKELVARYFIGRHSNPEMLDSVVEEMVRFAAERRDHPPGLEDGVTLFFLWPLLTVRERGNELILCEPHWHRDPLNELREEVSFSAQHMVMLRLIHDLVDEPPAPCVCHSTIHLEQGALESEVVLLFRQEPADDGDSGWVVTASGEDEIDAVAVPMSILATMRPHLCKVATLPVGWSAHFVGDRVVRVTDAEGVVRLEDDDEDEEEDEG